VSRAALVLAAAATGAAAALAVRALDEARMNRWRAALAQALITRPGYDAAGDELDTCAGLPPRLTVLRGSE